MSIQLRVIGTPEEVRRLTEILEYVTHLDHDSGERPSRYNREHRLKYLTVRLRGFDVLADVRET